MFVISICGLCSTTAAKLNWWPLCRDCFFYAISILVMLGTIYNETISWLVYSITWYCIQYCEIDTEYIKYVTSRTSKISISLGWSLCSCWSCTQSIAWLFRSMLNWNVGQSPIIFRSCRRTTNPPKRAPWWVTGPCKKIGCPIPAPTRQAASKWRIRKVFNYILICVSPFCISYKFQNMISFLQEMAFKKRSNSSNNNNNNQRYRDSPIIIKQKNRIPMKCRLSWCQLMEINGPYSPGVSCTLSISCAVRRCRIVDRRSGGAGIPLPSAYRWSGLVFTAT